jgi:hypothetical protein
MPTDKYNLFQQNDPSPPSRVDNTDQPSIAQRIGGGFQSSTGGDSLYNAWTKLKGIMGGLVHSPTAEASTEETVPESDTAQQARQEALRRLSNPEE